MRMTSARVGWTFLWVTCCLLQGVLSRVLVDMTGPGCMQVADYVIADDQVYTLYADYHPNQKPTLDHCDVGIRAKDSNRRLEYLVEKLTIFDCGIKIWIYDNPRAVSEPSRQLTCNDDKNVPITGKTSHGIIKFSLRKESVQATALSFQIQVKTDYGPPFDFEKDSSTFYEMPLDTSAIVGIVVAGAILVIAVAGLAIYCCLRTRMKNQRKYAEASDGPSTTTVYTTGASGVIYKPRSSKQRAGQTGGGFHGPASQDGSSKVSSEASADFYSNNSHAGYKNTNGRLANSDANGHTGYKGANDHTAYEDVGGYPASKGSIRSRKDTNIYTNEADGEERLERQASYRSSQKRRQHNASFDDADHTHVKGGHVSRRDSGRAVHIKYDKKTNYSRNDDYGTYGKVKKQPGAGILKAPSRSPVSSRGSVGSTVDSDALVNGYISTDRVHPNIRHVPKLDPRPRSRSRSRSQGPGSHRSGSVSRSRTGSVGRSGGRDTHREAPKTERQYGDMSAFLPDQQRDHHRSRSRSASMGRRSRR